MNHQEEAWMLSAFNEDEVRDAFERGLQWFLSKEPAILGDECRMMSLSGLLLIDPQRVPEVRKALAPSKGRDPIDPFFAAVEASPLPVPWDEPDPFQRYVPDDLPLTLHDREWLDGQMAHAALWMGTQGQLAEPVLSWVRQNDFWGYNLNHQILCWTLCLKRGHRVEEARERLLQFGAKLGHELANSPFQVFYDLIAESTVMLSLAGFPMEKLAGNFRYILSSQDADGGWWFTREPAELGPLIENSHLGASPLFKPPRHYSEEPDPERALDALVTLHRSHSTSLSLWALGLLLRGRNARPA
jgi:hypothetical protein